MTVFLLNRVHFGPNMLCCEDLKVLQINKETLLDVILMKEIQ